MAVPSALHKLSSALADAWFHYVLLLGLAAYQRDELYWFSAFGVRLRPNEVFAATR